MDVCLDSSMCQFVSDRHACIFYDEQTNHYELLNYSEYGTVVDNCLYGFNLDPSADLDDDCESDSFTGEVSANKKKVGLILLKALGSNLRSDFYLRKPFYWKPTMV